MSNETSTAPGMDEAILIPRKLFTMTVDGIDLAITGMETAMEHRREDWIAFALCRDALVHLKASLQGADR